MSYQKRRIVEAPFYLGDEEKKHPAVIISDPSVFEQEGFYHCVMITGSSRFDKFSFRINDDDLDIPLKKPSQIRMHISMYFWEDELMRDQPENYLSETAFERLIHQMQSEVYGIEPEFLKPEE